MTLTAGTRLGPYEILSPLGAGGMGEVYRARDTRLNREVAVKVLPEAFSSDPDRLKRFEKEALAASALSHPNIVMLLEVGREGGTSYLVTELVDGKTLRELLMDGPLPIKRLLSLAPQVADGLARAHEAGIVHRDLKPENLMVTKDGFAKILDFGLAKLTQMEPPSGEQSHAPTVTRGTEPGTVMGTVGYMSPEQASGHSTDYRSDQFSLGAILYEMATGRRAFLRATAVQTLAAIVQEEPEPLHAVNPKVSPPFAWIVERCLAKDPNDRFASTRDLARDLASVRDHASEVAVSGAAPTVRRSPLPRILASLGLGGLLIGAYLAGALRDRRTVAPAFQKITFQQGAIYRARFGPDGQTVVYAMFGVGSDNKNAEIYSTRIGSLDSRPLGLPPADILSISRSGQMAIHLLVGPEFGIGTLAEASLAGGTPRQILEDVRGADWSPDGKELAVSHDTGGKHRLEYPVGKVLYESSNVLGGGPGGPLVLPDGERVAFWEAGSLRLVDRKGALRTLVEHSGPDIGWSSGRDEIWWIRFGGVASEVHAVTLTGRERVVASLPGHFVLQDLSDDGRMLVERVSQSWEMAGVFPGETFERSLTWLDSSVPADLSADGRMLLFRDRGDTAGTSTAAYLRQTDGSPAVRLGEGFALALSPDGKWALARRMAPDLRLVLLPTGAGQERSLSPGTLNRAGSWARFHPDGKRVFFEGSEPGRAPRAYEQSLETGSPKPVTPEGVVPCALSPDGARLAALDRDRNLVIVPTDAKAGVAPRSVTRMSSQGDRIQWSADGRSLFIADVAAIPIRVDRLDLSSGRRSPWRSLSPSGRWGGGNLTNLLLAANERAWVCGYHRFFSELLVIDGLK
jgi:Tol biopolymer transport system component